MGVSDFDLKSYCKSISGGRKARVYLFEIDKKINLYKIGFTVNLLNRKRKLRASKILASSDRFDYGYTSILEASAIRRFSESFKKMIGKKEYFFIDESHLQNCISYINSIK